MSLQSKCTDLISVCWPPVPFQYSPCPVMTTYLKVFYISFSQWTERVKRYNLQVFFVCCFNIVGLISYLYLFHMLAHPHLNPSHQQIYFVLFLLTPLRPLCAIFSIFIVLFPTTPPPMCQFLHLPLTFEVQFLCFSCPLSSLYDFPHPYQSSGMYICVCGCVRERVTCWQGGNHGLCAFKEQWMCQYIHESMHM